MNLVTIVVPVYNTEKTLERCLRSIQFQTLADFEVLCINDGSTDGSENLILAFSQKDSRFKLVNKENGGLSSARNAGIGIANGKYICFIDSDDFIEPNMLERLSDLFKLPDCDLAGCGINVLYESWDSLKESDDAYYKVRIGVGESVDAELFSKLDVSSCNKMFKMSVIKEHNLRYPDGLLYEDAAFIWTYLPRCRKISYTEEKLYNYIRYQNSIMGQTFGQGSLRSLDHLKIIHFIISSLSSGKLLIKFKEPFLNFVLDSFWFSYRFLPPTKKYLSIIEVSKVLRTLDEALILSFTDLEKRRALLRLRNRSIIFILVSKVLGKVFNKLKSKAKRLARR